MPLPAYTHLAKGEGGAHTTHVNTGGLQGGLSATAAVAANESAGVISVRYELILLAAGDTMLPCIPAKRAICTTWFTPTSS
jgi:hypothetical protein